jgi:hypothetical protein
MLIDCSLERNSTDEKEEFIDDWEMRSDVQEK